MNAGIFSRSRLLIAGLLRTISDMWRIILAALILGCAVSLGACTAMRWEKQGLAVDSGNEDMGECRQRAYLDASHGYFNTFPRAYFGRDMRGRAFMDYRYWPDSERFMREQDYMNSCMRQRGYRLVPAEPGNRTPSP
jgi:hypothetical protein